MSVTTELLKWRMKILTDQGGLTQPVVKNKEWLYLFEEETRNSIMIEGYFTGKKELKDVISGTNTKSKHSDEIVGYYEAAFLIYEYAYQKYKAGEKFQLKIYDVMTIHSLMFKSMDVKWAGKLRLGDILINKAKIQPPVGALVDENMKFFIDYVNNDFSEDDLFISLAKLHTLFESIHPFEDGNGRVGRILINYVLVSLGFPNIIIKGTDLEKEKYFAGLEHAELGLYDFFPNNIPNINWTKKGDFSGLAEIIQKGLFHSLDHMLLSQYDYKKMISVKDLLLMKGFSESYGRKLIERGKVIAKKIAGQWYTVEGLWRD